MFLAPTEFRRFLGRSVERFCIFFRQDSTNSARCLLSFKLAQVLVLRIHPTLPYMDQGFVAAASCYSTFHDAAAIWSELLRTYRGRSMGHLHAALHGAWFDMWHVGKLQAFHDGQHTNSNLSCSVRDAETCRSEDGTSQGRWLSSIG